MSAMSIVKSLLEAETEPGCSVAEHFGGRLEGANSRRPRAVFEYLKPCWVTPLLEAIVETDTRLRIQITPSEGTAFLCRAEVGFDRPVVG